MTLLPENSIRPCGFPRARDRRRAASPEKRASDILPSISLRIPGFWTIGSLKLPVEMGAVLISLRVSSRRAWRFPLDQRMFFLARYKREKRSMCVCARAHVCVWGDCFCSICIGHFGVIAEEELREGRLPFFRIRAFARTSNRAIARFFLDWFSNAIDFSDGRDTRGIHLPECHRYASIFSIFPGNRSRIAPRANEREHYRS